MEEYSSKTSCGKDCVCREYPLNLFVPVIENVGADTAGFYVKGKRIGGVVGNGKKVDGRVIFKYSDVPALPYPFGQGLLDCLAGRIHGIKNPSPGVAPLLGEFELP
ncbi:MAG: hypothetical protein A4E58_00028 [Syntrophorhabdus sp. PtaB.Bin006]|nr:MAG: hypothetical protein A4E58_00028 [Syntrophorhabdus sp. PtaB.Bin006]